MRFSAKFMTALISGHTAAKAQGVIHHFNGVKRVLRKSASEAGGSQFHCGYVILGIIVLRLYCGSFSSRGSLELSRTRLANQQGRTESAYPAYRVWHNAAWRNKLLPLLRKTR